MSSFQVRPAVAADAPFVRALYAICRADEVSAWGWPAAEGRAFLEQQARAREAAYARQYPDAADEIVEVDGTTAGRRLVHTDLALIQLIDLALLPVHRGRGIGTALVQDLVALAKARACPLRLQVARDNPAQRLYARLGLAVVGGDDLRVTMEWSA
jgi:GNAT superfamily N-acetyltransferase